MTIKQLNFDDEKELHSWVENNINDLFGDVIYLTGNFYIYTKREKRAMPDGFLLDINNSSWTIIESELIRHGVWDHIAEQIVRFIVAIRNDSTKRKIRDYFFEELEKGDQIKPIAKQLKMPESRMIQKIENILETATPDIAIFIDDINEDLLDMVEALNATIRVYKIQKYLANDKIEYLNPEGKKSALETSTEDLTETQGNIAEALDALGGGKLRNKIGRVAFYALESGEDIAIRYSKFYNRDPNYWYGITPNTIQTYEDQKITHLGLIIGQEGVIKLPFDILKEYCNQANTSKYPDGLIKHYHIQLKTSPELILYTTTQSWEIGQYLFVYD